MNNNTWSLLFCLVLPISIAGIALIILLYGWRSAIDQIGNEFMKWLDKK